MERFWIVELVRNARREEHQLGAAEIAGKRCRHESLMVNSVLMNMDHERGISVNLSDRMQDSLQVKMAAISTSRRGEHIGEPQKKDVEMEVGNSDEKAGHFDDLTGELADSRGVARGRAQEAEGKRSAQVGTTRCGCIARLPNHQEQVGAAQWRNRRDMGGLCQVLVRWNEARARETRRSVCWDFSVVNSSAYPPDEDKEGDGVARGAVVELASVRVHTRRLVPLSLFSHNENSL